MDSYTRQTLPHYLRTSMLQERLNAAKRRRSIADDDKSNLKNKFTQLRRRSEQVSPQTFRRILRSQSIGAGLDVAGLATDGGPPRSPTTPTVPDQSLLRKRRPLSASYPAEQKPDDNVFDGTDSTSARNSTGETLAERIERRRQARISVINDSNEALARGVKPGETNPIHERIQRRRRSRLNLDEDARQEATGDGSAEKTQTSRQHFMLRGRRNVSADNLYASHDSLQSRGDGTQLSPPAEQYKKQTTPLAALRGRWERQATVASFSASDGSSKPCIGIDGKRFSRYSSGGYSRKDDALSTDQAALAGRDYRETLRKLRGGNIVTQKRT